MMATTNGTTHGTPCRAINAEPRLTLQIATSAMPAAAMKMIVRSVMLSGGALRPGERRRTAREIENKANRPTSTTRVIQPARGVMLP